MVHLGNTCWEFIMYQEVDMHWGVKQEYSLPSQSLHLIREVGYSATYMQKGIHSREVLSNIFLTFRFPVSVASPRSTCVTKLSAVEMRFAGRDLVLANPWWPLRDPIIAHAHCVNLTNWPYCSRESKWSFKSASLRIWKQDKMCPSSESSMLLYLKLDSSLNITKPVVLKTYLQIILGMEK